LKRGQQDEQAQPVPAGFRAPQAQQVLRPALFLPAFLPRYPPQAEV